jgi:hypothetical protein
MESQRESIETGILNLLKLGDFESGEITQTMQVKSTRKNRKEEENWTFVIRNSEIIGIVRNWERNHGEPYTYYSSSDTNGLVFLRDYALGVKERIEFQKNGNGDIRVNEVPWDLANWKKTHLFEI